MKMTMFNASCPFEIGDKVRDSGAGKMRTITDIVCLHYVRNGQVEFLFELDNSGDFVKIITEKFPTQHFAGNPVAHRRRLRRFTQRTPAGASLVLDNPQNDIEAAEQVQKKFKGALNLLADFEDLGFTPQEMKTDVKEVCAILHKYPICTADFMAIAEFCAETALHNDSLRRFLQFALKEYHERV